MLRRAHRTAAGSMSTACTSIRSEAATRAALTAPEPQHRSTTTAPGGGSGDGLVDQEFGATAGYEDSGIHRYPQAVELRPAEDVLEGQAGDPAVDHRGEVRRGRGRGDEQPRLLLGEDASGRTQPGDDGRPGVGRGRR